MVWRGGGAVDRVGVVQDVVREDLGEESDIGGHFGRDILKGHVGGCEHGLQGGRDQRQCGGQGAEAHLVALFELSQERKTLGGLSDGRGDVDQGGEASPTAKEQRGESARVTMMPLAVITSPDSRQRADDSLEVGRVDTSG